MPFNTRMAFPGHSLTGPEHGGRLGTCGDGVGPPANQIHKDDQR
jgi:hypothetical protein